MLTRIAVVILVLAPAVASAQATRPATRPTTQESVSVLMARLDELASKVKGLESENRMLRIRLGQATKKTPVAPPAAVVAPMPDVAIGMSEAEVDKNLAGYVKKVTSYTDEGRTLAYGFHPSVQGQPIFERRWTIYMVEGKVSRVVIHDPTLVEE